MPGPSLHRVALHVLLLIALVAATLSTPSTAAACQCMGRLPGDVVFTGTVIDSPNELGLFHDVFANAGVYTFDVLSVERGEVFDGRVYSGGLTCESAYQVGATYRMHAGDVAEGSDWIPSDVSLAIGSCMTQAELIAPRTPLTAFPHWLLSSEGVQVLAVVGLALLVTIGVYLSWRRSSRPAEADSG